MQQNDGGMGSCTLSPENKSFDNITLAGKRNRYSLTPEFFEWEFDPDCTPEHFKIKFSPDPHFGIARFGMTDGELTWPPSGATYPQAPSEPATEYFWNVRAWTDGVNGPDSVTRVFFTGLLCTSASEMGEPDLLFPDPGEVIGELYAELHYQAGEPR